MYTRIGNKPAMQQVNDSNQEILPHEFSESENKDDSELPQTGTPDVLSSDPRGNSQYVSVMARSLQSPFSSNGFQNNANDGINQINAISDASSSHNYGPYGSPGIVNVPGCMTAGTVLTPLGTLVTPVGTIVTEQQIENNQYSYQCPTENRYTVLQDRPYSDVLNVNDSAKSASELNNAQGSIPVIMSNRTDKRLASRRDRYNPRSHLEPAQYENDDSEDDFEMHIRRRSNRFYIGGFKPSISSAKLQHYVTRKGVPVTWISIRIYEKQNKAVIRLNVDAEQADKVLEARGITCRPWLTKNQYKNKNSNTDRYGHLARDSYDDGQTRNIRRYGDDHSVQ